MLYELYPSPAPMSAILTDLADYLLEENTTRLQNRAVFEIPDILERILVRGA